MKIQTIEYFISVAESLSFTKGAQENYIAQPAMSRQMALLEREIGVDLFVRNGRSVELTKAGQTFLTCAHEMIDLYYQSLEKTRESQVPVTNIIRIGIDQHRHGLLWKMIEKMKEKDTDIQLIIRQYPFTELLSELINGKLDIIFGIPISAEDIESKDIKMIKVSPFNTDIILNKSHRLSDHAYIHLQDLNGETFISFSEDTGPFASAKLKLLLENHGLKANNILYTNSLESQLLMVEMGLGVAIIPDFCCIFNNANLKNIPIKDFPIKDYTCAYLNNRKSKSFTSLIDIILSVAQTQY